MVAGLVVACLAVGEQLGGKTAAGVVFFAAMAMIARQLPVLKWGRSFSLEWAVYFAAVVLFGPVGAALVPLLSMLGLQAILCAQRKRVDGEEISRALEEAGFRGAAQGWAGFLAALAMAAAASGGSLIGWVSWVVLTAVLPAVGASLQYRVSPIREMRRFFGERFAETVLALPVGAGLALLYLRYWDGTVLVTTLILALVLLLYTLLVFADMQGAYWATIHILVRTMESKDQMSPGEGQRGACLAAALARKLHLPEQQVCAVYLGGLLRDIGLVGVDERLADQPGALQDEQYRQVVEHTVIGSKILEPLPHLRGAALAIRHHHERWDGLGYPDAHKGEEIPLEGRLVAIADAYVAMTSDRPFRHALSSPEAWKQIEAGAGRQFDPRLVRLFRHVVAEEEAWGRNVFKRHHTLLPGS